MNKQSDTKHLFRVAQKAFKAKNMINVESNIEATKNNPEHNYYSFLEDVIFFKIAPGTKSTEKYTYNTKNQIVMQMNFDDLRQLMYGCKELYKTGKTDYKNYTDPNLTSTSTGNRKELSLGRLEGAYFVNITSGETKYSFNFNTYSFLSFIDSLKIISDETERILYTYQRKNDYKIKFNVK
jgi:hypothetical protein